MATQQIQLKTVHELRTFHADERPQRFFIPAYQRGYRWSSLQITQLLDDFREFTQRPNPQPQEFYCLQPLVIKARPQGDWEVVDGQQRLTTLLLILRHFNERLAERFRQPLYLLDYETRPKLAGFLDEPSPALADTNADYFHLYVAMQTIENWFAQHESEVETIKAVILNQVKLIWFELAEGDHPVEAFTRLNVGKIPLTSDELIRALFLRRSTGAGADPTSAQLRIAYEWDLLEKALQNNAFWYFISNKPAPAQNRIGLLFELVAQQDGLPQAWQHDAYAAFHHVNGRLKASGASVADEWGRIKSSFLQLEEWFEDRMLFHMVGYLVHQSVGINSIRQLAQGTTKSGFELTLRREIFKCVTGYELSVPVQEAVVRERLLTHMDRLSYDRKVSHVRIRALLLLFNLATLLQDGRSNLRFQFDSFKTQCWDIEHIRSVSDDRPGRPDTQKTWLEHCLRFLTAQGTANALCKEIDIYLADQAVSKTPEVFDGLYDRVLEFFAEAKEWEEEHGLGNLTLLDDHTNRSYGNAVFALKRQRLLSLDQAGIFVPLCTRNIFLKCYSPQVGNTLFWTEQDREAYETVMLDTLTRFFCGSRRVIQ
ncbi:MULTISPECIES: DUF262 domain-containing protein [Aeromonas]|jgi:hypothetical protein|uniref:DUF262 domain-containing protein n=2 Tax=Aeromonas TaxID=642 RepID=A0A7T3X0J6_AERCA|nr:MULTISPECIES: DUF262 domain-containing protein [Aeromonas]AUV17064.1 hypothetical protein C2U47_11060 [Aeromonas sp. ASNIH7]MDM5112087.1 DUF262 domain-containing HNH endonuclease family protein [Aeromonas caviae]MDX7920050.1 DUF262 domain-containing protein [Aeromonas caviae]PTH81277.1 DUF262 domain-containing protein [Aeromonas veronii]QQA60018.1 DUF262 domain-containing protein [Aeromonas caviae]